jgi:ABC-type transport system involved in cytochrome bd biosynthesis fused ATPase/permease subunit
MKQLSLVLAAVFVIIAILYWTGHGIPAGVHAKHGIVSIVLALLCLVWYRFQSAEPAR